MNLDDDWHARGKNVCEAKRVSRKNLNLRHYGEEDPFDRLDD